MSHESDQASVLTYGVLPPALVYTTTDPSSPISNRLEFGFFNSSRETSVELVNPQGLTPGSELPPWNAGGGELDRVYVWFPWGSNQGDLCTLAEAGAITLSSNAASGDWYAVPLSDPTIGPYWIIFPRSKTTLAPQQSRGFFFGGIVTESAPDMPDELTVLEVTPRFGGEKGAQTSLPVTKAVPPLAVTRFEASQYDVLPQEQVTFYWTTTGATSCELEPGSFRGLAPNGSQVVRIGTRDTPFTLTAIAENGTRTSAQKTVGIETGWTRASQRNPWPFFITPQLFDLAGKLVFVNIDGTVYTSEDSGVTWATASGQAPFAGQQFPFGGVVGDMILVAGGHGSNGDTANVYASTDGVTWETAGPTPFGARAFGASAVLDGRLWTIAGTVPGGYCSEVWSTADGKAWEQVTAPTPWHPRTQCAAAAFEDRIWLVGGHPGGSGPSYSDTWISPDGSTWTQGPNAPWSGEELPILVAAGGALYLISYFTGADRDMTMWRLSAGEQGWILVNEVLPFGSTENNGILPPLVEHDGYLLAAEFSTWAYVPDAAPRAAGRPARAAAAPPA